MTVPHITKAQSAFLARSAVVEALDGLPYEVWADDGSPADNLGKAIREGWTDERIKDELELSQELIDGYRLVINDLERARTIMEEQAAFGQLVDELEVLHPELTRLELQRMARSAITNRGEHDRAVKASNVYERIGAVR